MQCIGGTLHKAGSAGSAHFGRYACNNGVVMCARLGIGLGESWLANGGSCAVSGCREEADNLKHSESVAYMQYGRSPKVWVPVGFRSRHSKS